MLPSAVAAVPALGRRLWKRRVALQPFEHSKVIELFRPQQTPMRLLRNLKPGGRRFVNSVEQVRFLSPLGENTIEVHRSALPFGAQTEAEFDTFACRNLLTIVRCDLGSGLRGIDGRALALRHEAMKRVLHIRC